MNFLEKLKHITEDFVKEKSQQVKSTDLDTTVQEADVIEEKISSSSVLDKYVEIVKVMISMLRDYKNGFYKKVPWFTIGAVVFSLLYILNPLDIVPDFIPVLGYIDDVTVLGFALKFIETDIHNYLDWKLDGE
ncbi:YkvA family protein [Mesonia sp. K7]|uniref:YkvA family protein n=1 Tax=Mesonia sp. K7 TaxID=2218606 RepID=UPI000DA80E11|nr:YkvA family protein [Mesonia sp. K7]PZD77583.1 DUF1232 domain-containing protein [Mesonia sp. K7]